MVEAKLVGLNKDLESGLISPESIVAAYARISRSEDNLSTLRKKAREDVEKARESNKKIVFGLGHGSVSEHAITNWDITDLSRLATEWFEEGRFNSYTEKSQRYVNFANSNFEVPGHWNNLDKGMFRALINKQIECYNKLIDQNVNPEDARYILPLATKTQLGTTLNARSLEKMILEGRKHPLKEVQHLAEQMYVQAKKFMPSLVSHADDDTHAQYPFMENCDCDFRTAIDNLEILNYLTKKELNENLENVNLIEHNNIDDIILSAIVSKYGNVSIKDAKKILDSDNREQFFKDCFKNLSKYEKMPREFELGNLLFELYPSASNFAQLKRHRPGHTLIKSPYNPELGYVTPESVNNKMFHETIKNTNKIFEGFRDKYGEEEAQYCLTNAHKRRVLSKMNMREFYHFSRLREDGHAQWDIRKMAHEMVNKVKEIAPITSLLLGGKDQYDQIKEELYK